jgi:hypothetical protein
VRKPSRPSTLNPQPSTLNPQPSTATMPPSPVPPHGRARVGDPSHPEQGRCACTCGVQEKDLTSIDCMRSSGSNSDLSSAGSASRTCGGGARRGFTHVLRVLWCAEVGRKAWQTGSPTANPIFLMHAYGQEGQTPKLRTKDSRPAALSKSNSIEGYSSRIVILESSPRAER